MASTFAPPHLICEFDRLSLTFDISIDCRGYGVFGELKYRAGEHEPLRFHGDGIVAAIHDALRVAGTTIKH